MRLVTCGSSVRQAACVYSLIRPVGFKYSATGLTCGWAGDLPGGYAAGSYWLIKPRRI
jgi:hypothetical protein